VLLRFLLLKNLGGGAARKRSIKEEGNGGPRGRNNHGNPAGVRRKAGPTRVADGQILGRRTRRVYV